MISEGNFLDLFFFFLGGGGAGVAKMNIFILFSMNLLESRKKRVRILLFILLDW